MNKKLFEELEELMRQKQNVEKFLRYGVSIDI